MTRKFKKIEISDFSHVIQVYRDSIKNPFRNQKNNSLSSYVEEFATAAPSANFSSLEKDIFEIESSILEESMTVKYRDDWDIENWWESFYTFTSSLT